MARPLFQLGPRLSLCASLVREGAAVADIGTDHGYLPIWLLKTGRCPRAIAADINASPLEAARRNAARYGAKMRLLLSDGLQGLGPGDAEDIVIAGMGGELILRMAGETPWLRNPGKRLVLQPMSCGPQLRAGLWDLGFSILEERACLDSGKVYAAFSAAFTGKNGPMPLLYPYMGRLEPGSPAVRLYAEKQARILENQRKGAAHLGETARAKALGDAMEALREAYLGESIEEEKGTYCL